SPMSRILSTARRLRTPMPPRASTRSTSRAQGRRPALKPSVRITRIPSSLYGPTCKREVSPCTYPALHSLFPLHVPRAPLFWITPGYCWPTHFKVLEVLFLGEVCSAFLPSKKACWAHQFRYLGVGQQYPPVWLT